MEEGGRKTKYKRFKKKQRKRPVIKLYIQPVQKYRVKNLLGNGWKPDLKDSKYVKLYVKDRFSQLWIYHVRYSIYESVLEEIKLEQEEKEAEALSVNK
jgi:hypothetical protein